MISRIGTVIKKSIVEDVGCPEAVLYRTAFSQSRHICATPMYVLPAPQGKTHVALWFVVFFIEPSANF